MLSSEPTTAPAANAPASGCSEASSGAALPSSGLNEHWLFAKRSMADGWVRKAANPLASSTWAPFAFTLTRVSTLTTSTGRSSRTG